jgi:SAM-dependent methyltransferase
MTDSTIQSDVRRFYDAVGWQQVSEGVYQNAEYEDLRPVSRDYIHKCHMRVNRYLGHSGKYFLDAGSGPIQYPEYLEYSKSYQYRVCLDISIVALLEAKKRIRKEGLFVVADIARMPFKHDAFSDVVSLHTIHHLPPGDYKPAYLEIRRVMKQNATAVIVNGWSESAFMRVFRLPMHLIEKVRQKGHQTKHQEDTPKEKQTINAAKPAGTFVHKLTAKNLKEMLKDEIAINIKVWRSVSVPFLRAFIHPHLLGRFLLKVLYAKEELFPGFFGKYGQYPLIVFKKI